MPTNKVNFRTWVKNDLVTAADLNEQVRDNGNAIWTGTAQGDMDWYHTSTYKDPMNDYPSYHNEIGAVGKVLKNDSWSPFWPVWRGFTGRRLPLDLEEPFGPLIIPANSYALIGKYLYGVSTFTPDTNDEDEINIWYGNSGLEIYSSQDEEDQGDLTFLVSMTLKLLNPGVEGKVNCWFQVEDWSVVGGAIASPNIYTTKYMNGVDDFWVTMNEIVHCPKGDGYTDTGIYLSVWNYTAADLTITDLSATAIELN